MNTKQKIAKILRGRKQIPEGQRRKNFKYIGTTTGRVQSRMPNMSNLPKNINYIVQAVNCPQPLVMTEFIYHEGVTYVRKVQLGDSVVYEPLK